MLTPHQQYLVNKAKALGFGYACFSANIVRHGTCTPKQEQALEQMVAAGEFRKNNWSPSRCHHSPAYKHTISDVEAMQSGDYF